MIRAVAGYIIASLAGFSLASLSHSFMNARTLAASGAPMPADVFANLAIGDAQGLASQFGPAVAIALGVGFVVARFLRPILKAPHALAYMLAGAAAIPAMLLVMSLAFEGIMPIAGARGAGLALQGAAGAAAGLAFALIARPRAR
jgi:hypothetical protein